MDKKIAIIGGGPAGYTAAIYAARAGYKPIVFTGFQPGGQLMITTEVDNYPGFRDGIQGPELMDEMRAQAERFGAEIREENVEKIERLTRFTHDLESPHDAKLLFGVCVGATSTIAHAVIIATGASAKWLGAPGEKELNGFGVSACATCDGFFFRNKTVAVIGGGDTAMEEAIYLAKLCKKVFLVHRSEKFRASQIMLDRARATENIEFVVNAHVNQIYGDGKVQGVRLHTDYVDQGDSHAYTVRTLDVDGVFIAIGHKPNSELVADLVDIDVNGYIITGVSTHTRTPGLFAAGDVTDPIYRQAVTSAGRGCMAAIDAVRYLESL